MDELINFWARSGL